MIFKCNQCEREWSVDNMAPVCSGCHGRVKAELSEILFQDGLTSSLIKDLEAGFDRGKVVCGLYDNLVEEIWGYQEEFCIKNCRKPEPDVPTQHTEACSSLYSILESLPHGECMAYPCECSDREEAK